MIVVALLLVVASLMIALDGWRAWARYRGAPAQPEPATTAPV
jgi:hypothetical protein